MNYSYWLYSIYVNNLPKFTLEPELICSWSNKTIIKNSKIFQKILIFFGDEHIHICYIRANFRDEITFLLLCVKKTKLEL